MDETQEKYSFERYLYERGHREQEAPGTAPEGDTWALGRESGPAGRGIPFTEENTRRTLNRESQWQITSR